MELIYKREEYLKKVRGFYKDDMIKVITGIRRCGKSYLLKSIILELKDLGIPDKDIIYIELDKKEYNDIVTTKQLEKAIDSKITDNDFKYLFIDEVQNVKGYEKIINSYREEGNISIFLTGSISYLLSGELAKKLTGRHLLIEMLPLNFYEYIQKRLQKHFLIQDYWLLFRPFSLIWYQLSPKDVISNNIYRWIVTTKEGWLWTFTLVQE